MTERGGTRWLQSLGGALQAGGGATLALGAVSLLAPLLGCDRGFAAAAVAPIGLAFVARTVEARSMHDGVSGALRRMLVTALGAASVVAAIVLSLGRTLGDAFERPSGALAVMCAGLLVALLGRLPAAARGRALVTAKEWASTDDAVVVAVVTMLAAAATVGADLGPMVAAVIGRLDAVSTPIVGVLLLAALGLPSMGVAALMATPPGRSPVARGLLIAGFAPLLGAGLMHLAGAGPAAIAETTTMIDDRLVARIDVWQASLAVGAICSWVGAVVAALVALGAGIRARAHGVLHDQQERRASVLQAALLCSAVLMLVGSRLQASLGPLWSMRPALTAGIFAAIGVMAVHMGVAALGDVSSPLQHRAGGYVASAAVSAVVAVLLAALGSSLAALCRVRVSSPFDWLSLLSEAARTRRYVFAVGASFVLPVVAAAIIAGYRRGLRRWAVTAIRHVAYGVLLVSVALLLVAARLPEVRQGVRAPWSAAVPPMLRLPEVAVGLPCFGLHHARVVAIDDDGVHQGGEHLGELESLSSPERCARVAEHVNVSHRALTVAVDQAVSGRALACLFRAIGERIEGTPEACEVQLLARDAAGIPRCATGVLGIAACRRAPTPHLAHLSGDRVLVDLGPVPARVRAGRFPEDAYLWETEPFGTGGVALWASGDTESGSIVRLWHRLAARTPAGSPLVYLLPAMPSPVRDPGSPLEDVEVSLAASVSGEVAAVSRVVEEALWSRRRALARCHRRGDALAERVSASYRAVVDARGRLSGIAAAGGAASWPAARCLATILAELQVEDVAATTMVVMSLHLHERLLTAKLPEEDDLPASL